jgi:hypothetical protein
MLVKPLLCTPASYGFHGTISMIRIAGGVLVLLALIVGLCAINDALSFSIVGTLMAILLIVVFGIAATGWTIRHDN